MKSKYWFTVNKGGNPTYTGNDPNVSDKYCASCLKSVRKEICKKFVVLRIHDENEDQNPSICPFCTKTWRQWDGHVGDYIGNLWDNEIMPHYARHLDGRNPVDDNPDFQIVDNGERERQFWLISNSTISNPLLYRAINF